MKPEHRWYFGTAEDKTNQYLAIDKLIKQLKEEDYSDEKDKNILLTNNGINNVEKYFQMLKF